MNEDLPPPNKPSSDRGEQAGSAPSTGARPRWEEPRPGGEARRDEAREPGRSRSDEPSGSRWEEPSARPAGGAAPRSDDAFRDEPGRSGAYRDERGSRGTYRGPDPDPHAAQRERLQQNVTSKSTWLRFVFLVLFAALLSVAEVVLVAVVAIQFVWVLINGEPNGRLQSFGQSLARYAYQVIRYLTFNGDARPFPVDLDWPSDTPDRFAG